MKTKSALSLALICGLTAFSGNIGYAEDYNKPDVEVNRSVLKDLENYTPPQMFGGAVSQKIENVKENPAAETTTKPLVRKVEPPVTPSLTAPAQPPSAEALLDHPAQNNHVLTIQKPSEQVTPLPVLPVPPTAPIEGNLTPLPKPAVMTAAAPKADLPPRPMRKPALAKAAKETAPTTMKTAIIEPEKPAKAPAPASAPVNAYKPSTPQTMPAVPPVVVEKATLPDVANLPPIDPEKVEKPSVGERLMDDALTRNMVKDEGKLREVLGVPSAIAPSAPATEDTNQFSLAFKEGVAELVADQKKMMAEEVLPRLAKDKTARIEIKAYASRTDGTESSARRISLSRALSARSYLLEKGIKPTRIDVRALSDRTAEPPMDRIDMTFTHGSAPNS